jgi:hypothetical protein
MQIGDAMTDPNPPIVKTESGSREQRWPLPADEQHLLDLIRLCFNEYWDEIWFGIIMEGAAREVAAPNPPKQISMFDGFRRLCHRRLRSLAFPPVYRRAAPSSAGSAGVRVPSYIG